MREIKSTELKTVKDIAPPHPVFLLEFSAGNPPNLVVKAETKGVGGASRYNAIAEVMAQIGRNTESKRLDRAEMGQLSAAVHAGKTTALMGKILQFQDVFWVKMPYQPHLVDLMRRGFGADFTEEQKQTIKNVIGLLANNQRAWESLGQVIAADYFLGNGDRISWDDEGKVRLQNPGNIFFKFNKNGQLKKALALDNYDPFGTPTHDVNIDLWLHDFAPVLKYTGLARGFASGVVASISRYAEEAGVSVPLNNGESSFFFNGFQQGIDKVKVYVQRKYPNLPPGIVARATQLGWHLERQT